MDEPLQREPSLVQEALKLPLEQRADFIRAAAAGDPALLQRLEEQILAAPPPAEVATATAQPGTIRLSLTTHEQAGDQIGPYKLLQLIGEGGMGSVWVAEQSQPVYRQVALKLIKSGLGSNQVLARFEAERQAIALMEHPNIAKFLDAGALPNGRPYFVMEWVRGTPLTKFCDEQRLSLRERLELFVPVCLAVQHAHQKGVIHRDLKPSNVLLTMYDGRPVPKVIDFGVAKATGARLTDRTVFTEFGAVVGTLEYMSPEQAELNQLDIDTRSDIYSLGVLLYELLTGTTPLTREILTQITFPEALRRIREEEPPPPSIRLSQSKESLARIAAERKMDPAQLTASVRGDLTSIVMKTLEKNRARRYETANGLAADLQRYLRNEPVLARSQGNLYRFQKLVRRNKLAFTAATALLLLLLTISIGAPIVAWRIHEARKQEEKQRTVALTINSFLQEIFKAANPTEGGGASVTVKELLDAKGSQIDSRFRDYPETLMNLHKIIGQAYEGLRLNEQARPHLETALRLKQQLDGTNDLLTADILETLGYVTRGTESQNYLDQAATLVLRFRGSNSVEYQRVKSYEAGTIFTDANPVDGEEMFLVAYGLFTKEPAQQVRRRMESDLVKVGESWRAGNRSNALAMIHAYARPFLGLPMLGSEAPMTVAVIARRERRLGHTNTIEPLLVEASSLANSELTPLDPRRAQVFMEHALWLRNSGRHDEALSLMSQAWTVRTNKLGLRNEETLETGLILADSWLHLGHTNEVLELVSLLTPGAPGIARLAWEAIDDDAEWLATYLIKARGNEVAQFIGPGQQTLLHLAAARNQTNVAQLLLQRGLDIESTDTNRYTPLCCAVEHASLEVARLLVTHGARVRIMTTNGFTPLHLAARRDAAELAHLLIQQGARIDACDNRGSTPLHFAAAASSTNVARLLLVAGADTSLKDTAGRTALSLAEQLHQETFVALLKSVSSGAQQAGGRHD